MEILPEWQTGRRSFYIVVAVMITCQAIAGAADASIFSGSDVAPERVSLSQELNDRLVKSEVWYDDYAYRYPMRDAGYWYYWYPRAVDEGYGVGRYKNYNDNGGAGYQYNSGSDVRPEPRDPVSEEQKQLDKSSTYPIYMD